MPWNQPFAIQINPSVTTAELNPKSTFIKAEAPSPKGHKGAGVGPIAQKAVGKLRHAIEQSMQSKEQTQLSFFEAKTRLHHRHCDTQVFPNEVKSRVANDRS